MAGHRKSCLKIGDSIIGVISRSLMVAGAAMLVFYAAATLHRLVMSQLALREFSERLQTNEGRRPPQPSTPTQTPASPQPEKHTVDFSLWSSKRVMAYREAFAKQIAPPEAVLEIPRIGLRAPVFDGTDDLTLNRGLGRITGTARLSQEGNLGIAGHRDGFFRGLKDVALGDSIQLESTEGKQTYRVDQIRIVKPDDIQVLKARAAPSLTLVTCYPFYYIGNAPLRYIVQASLLHGTLHGKTGTQPD